MIIPFTLTADNISTVLVDHLLKDVENLHEGKTSADSMAFFWSSRTAGMLSLDVDNWNFLYSLKCQVA